VKKENVFRWIAFLLVAVLVAVGVIPSMTFAAESKATAKFAIETKISGDTPKEAETFTFQLTPEGNAPVPEKTTITIKGEGKGAFGEIDYTKVGRGVYNYTIQEKKGDDSNYTYDTKDVYHVRVRVDYNVSRQLTAVVSVRKNDSSEKTDAIVFVNKYDAPQAPIESSTEVPPQTQPQTPTEESTEGSDETDAEAVKRAKVVIKKVDSTGKILTGAKLAIKDSDTGEEILEWTTDGSSKDVTNQLSAGKTYYLVEKQAPSGYLVAADVEFTVPAKGGQLEIEMVDPKKEASSKLGSISVTKSIVLMDAFEDIDLYAEDETYYVGLFTDAKGNHPYGSDFVKAVHIQKASHAEVVYSNLPEGTYYVFETTQDGTPFMKDETVEVNGDYCTCKFEDDNNKVEIVQKTNQLDGKVNLINEYVDFPDGFSYRAMVNITKKVVFDGSAISTNDKFYAGIFTSETDETPMNVVSLSNNGTITAEVPLGGVNGDGAVTYYIYETDANGNKVDKDNFSYVVTGEGKVSLDKSQTEASITITNEAKDEPEYSEGTEIENSGKTIIETESDLDNELKGNSNNNSNNSNGNSNSNNNSNSNVNGNGSTGSQQTSTSPISQIVNSVVTGDTTVIIAYLLLLGVAGMGVVTIMRRKKK
jgi:pilin isopeptide linkage protein